MSRKHRLPLRELVFIQSLCRHGFKLRSNFKHIKHRYGYIVPATDREDAGGVDFYVKLQRESTIYPVQITQRGNRLHKHFYRFEEDDEAALHDAIARVDAQSLKRAEERLGSKRDICYENDIAFVLVRDYWGERTNPAIAWGDVKALRHGIDVLKKRQLE